LKVLQFTEQAKMQIKEMLDDSNDQLRLRFGVKNRNCNSPSYSMGFDQYFDEELDYLTEIKGIPITIKKEDITSVSGTIIDFKEDMMGGRFTVDHPGASNSNDYHSAEKGHCRELT